MIKSGVAMGKLAGPLFCCLGLHLVDFYRFEALWWFRVFESIVAIFALMTLKVH